MRRHHFRGLRARLVILVLVAMLPVIFLILLESVRLRDHEKAIARNEVIRLSRLVTSRQEQELESTRDHLMAVARIPPSATQRIPDSASANSAVARGAPAHDVLLEMLMRHHPHFIDLSVADANGRVIRSAVRSAQPRSVAGRPWFQAALRSHRYTVGDYETWGLEEKPVLTLAFPECAKIHPGSGDQAANPLHAVREVTFAVLDVGQSDTKTLDTDLPPHYAVSLFDRDGILLFREPDARKWRGTSVVGFPVVADLLANPRERVVEMRDLDGHRVWAFCPVHVQGESVAFVGVGLPLDITYAGARSTLRRSMLLFALMAFLSVALAWYIGERIVLPRLRGLLRAAEGVAEGKHGVRTGISHDSDEIGLLAGAFDRMASALDNREIELRRAEEDVRQSEAKYRLLFETAPMAAAVYDSQTLRFLMVNPMAEVCYGYTAAEFQEICIPDLFMPEDAPEIRRWIAEKHKEPVLARVWTHRRKDGTTFQAEAVSHYLEVNGRPARLVLVMDVTERFQASESLRASRDKLRDLANRLQSAREEERARIARGIHDELGQALTGLKMDMAWLRNRILQLNGGTDTDALLARIARMLGLTDDMVQEVRRIATELRPSVLDALGLVAALEWQARDFSSRFGIGCGFTSRIEELKLNPECSTAVFRIFQESLTNVARHADATCVDAHLDCVGKRICLSIQDNGVGIAPDVVEGSRSLGLLGLRERAQVIGADLTITGRPGAGTRVVLMFPSGPRGCLLSGNPCIMRSATGELYECANTGDSLPEDAASGVPEKAKL